jgi:ABC-type sulfate/molybdate transport systems ATPase subunit
MTRALARIERMESEALLMDEPDKKITFQRIERLKHWMERGQKMLPWILRFLVR